VDGGQQADHKQHAVAHICLCQPARYEEVQDAELPQQHIQRRDDDQKADHTARAAGPAPGIRNNFVALLLNDSPDVPQRNDIRVVRNIGVARAAADAGAQNARGAAEFLFDLILAVHAGHPADAKPRCFDTGSHMAFSFRST